MKGLGLIGKKLGMTTIFARDGRKVPVTVLKVGPCPIIQIKTKDKDGYEALQLGFESVKEKKVNRPLKGHQQKAGKGFYRFLKEFRVENLEGYELGQELTVDLFTVGEKVKITGVSKGRGFAGVMKRWNFGGSPDSHGHHKVHRTPGSIGQCADPSRVFKGKKMPGHMGNIQHTYKNIEILDVRHEDGLILVKGQVPGAKNSIVYIRKQS